MRIRSFWKNIEVNELKPYELKNCTVVIDGQNYLYNMYEKSGLPFQFGCESDKYAQYLREQLSIFKKANVQCYFMFKGGRVDIQRKIENVINRYRDNPYPESASLTPFALPVFMQDVYKEVLDEMNLNYVICEFECKKQCIALAQKLGCPLISFDIEFCFSGLVYVPCPQNSSSLRYDDIKRSLHCSVFSYADFVQKYNLDKDKLATFIVLTDEQLLPENYFQKFYDSINLNRINYFKRNLHLLKWLSSRSNDTILSILKKLLQKETIENFTSKKKEVREFICREETTEIPYDYLMQGNRLDFEDKDPLWFQKGVACGHVPLQYVNIYRWNIVFGSWCIEDTAAEDAMFLSLDMIKYAFNLLTNFERKELQLFNNKQKRVTMNVADGTAVPKPTYTAVQSPFENGWANIRSLKLFEHFLENSMPGFNFNRFDDLPEETRLLMISLVYFSQKKCIDTAVEVCSVILSYVMLGVVADKCDKSCSDDIELLPKHILDSITAKELVTDTDSAAAKAALKEYFTVLPSEMAAVLDRQILHPLVEFQHCLQQLNFLNKLCGSPLAPTRYACTYNGTFAYKVAQAIRTKYSGNVKNFVEELLSPAPTVLAFFNGLKEAYEEVFHMLDL